MKKFILLIGCLWITIAGIANNVVISNISLITSGGPGNYKVQFDLSWNNGWRVLTGQNNYDGVWVFFKYRMGGGDWQHLIMTGTGNSTPVPYFATQNSGTTKTGAIIHHQHSFFTGTTTLTNIELGVSDVGFGIDIRGYAIEMVYIPQSNNFILGDGNGNSESFNALHLTSGANSSGPIGSTFRVDVNGFDDALLESGLAINAAGIDGNSDFTTGQAFWSMKYELSQGAYRDFLNSLNLVGQTARTANTPTSAVGTGALTTAGTNRNFIEIAISSVSGIPAVYGLDASGNNIFDEAADGEWIACNFLSWMDLASYLDWAGLSPMTEIGFERICRGVSTAGINPSVLGEYAWGTTSLFATSYTLAGPPNTAGEFANISFTLGNANYSNTNPNPPFQGPFRNGIFALGAVSREVSGAAFYGVMEMSGNVSEPCVTVGNIAGRGFTSINGDGILSNGFADTPNWPCGATPSSLPNCGLVSGSAGTILRGGQFANANSLLSVSVRPEFVASISRTSTQGGRGVLYIH